jgi:hypothetical protein
VRVRRQTSHPLECSKFERSRADGTCAAPLLGVRRCQQDSCLVLQAEVPIGSDVRDE